MQQIQFATRVKRTPENRNRINRTHIKKQKILHNLDRNPEEILKVGVQKFLECRGYLPKAKSLSKSPLEDASSKEIKGLEPHCSHPFSVIGSFQ